MPSAAHTFWIDESYRSRFLTVGGFFASNEDLSEISDSWRELKLRMGLQPNDELKYNIPEDHPSRPALDDSGYTQAERIPLILDTIAAMPVTIVVTTVEDHRPDNSRHATDLYPDALRWVIRGFAFGVDRARSDLHRVVCDSPPQAGDLDRTSLSRRMVGLLSERGTHAFDLYRTMFDEPQATATGEWTALKNLRFCSCLLSSHARYSDHIQIADVVVGAIRDFVEHSLGSSDSWGNQSDSNYRDENVARLLPLFRRQRTAIWNRGFGFFPENDPAAATLKERLTAMQASDP